MDPKYDTSVEDGVFTFRFIAPKQILLHPEFERMVWDECLRCAHLAGHMPIGPIHITTEDYERVPEPLVEGEPMLPAQMADLVPADSMVVIAKVQIGLSL